MRIRLLHFAMVGAVFLNFAWLHAARGQVMVWKAGQKDFSKAARSGDPASPQAESSQLKEKSIRLSAMAEPVPALKFRFWVSPSMRQPGNVAPLISRALVQFLAHPNRSSLDLQYEKLSELWVERHVRDDSLSSHVSQQRAILETIYDAANMETLEQSSTQRHKIGKEVFAANLSEIQILRNLARLVQLDALLAIHERRYEHAIRAIGAGFRLAEFVQCSGDANLINGLVSVAISGITFSLVEEMSQQVDAPNLYWALASLPEVLWNQRGWIDGESASMSRILYPLLEPASASMTSSDWQNRLVNSAEVLMAKGSPFIRVGATASDESDLSIRASAKLVVGVALLAFGDRARTELIDSGIASEQVQRMSASEVVSRNTRLRFERSRDNLFKWSFLQSFGKSYSDSEWQEWRQTLTGAEFVYPSNILIGLLIPGLQAADSAALRCNITHKQLMLHESLRAYAATHDSKLPASLEALHPVPALPNPESGESFQYERLSDSEALVRRNPSYPNEIVVTRILLQSTK